MNQPALLHLMAATALTLALDATLPSNSSAAQPESQTPSPGAGRWEEFGGLVVPLAAADGITLRIITDLGVVAPTYQSFPRDNDRWIEHFASKLPAANRSFRDLLQASGWGHIAPYVYAAVYHSLGRIFIGFSSNPAFADGGPLIPKAALQPGEIRIKLYSDCAKYEEAAAAARMESSPEAFYDAGKRQVEFCLPPEAADVLRSLQPVDQARPEIAVAHMEEFANWLVLRLSAHELTHAIQQGTQVDDYRFALVREGVAMFLAENVLTRAETIVLLESRAASAPDLAKVKACDQAFGPLQQFAAPSPIVIDHFRAATTHMRVQPGFSITKLLDDEAFYAGDPRAHYALAFVFLRFLHTADRVLVEAWRRVSALAAGKTDSADLWAIDQGFVRYLEAWPGTWWERPDAKVRAETSARASTECKRHGLLLPAHAAALLLNAYKPASAQGLVYDGDVFWQAGKFFVALDRYRDAARLLAERDPLGAMVQSRLGDAYEQLGSVDAALRAYRAAAAHPFPVEFVMTILRGELKLSYYDSTRADGAWATQESRERLFGYIRDFQAPEALTEITRRCEGDARFDVCRAKLIEQRFAEVSERMKMDLQAGRR